VGFVRFEIQIQRRGIESISVYNGCGCRLSVCVTIDDEGVKKSLIISIEVRDCSADASYRL